MANFIFKIVYYIFETESLYWALGHFVLVNESGNYLLKFSMNISIGNFIEINLSSIYVQLEVN